MFFGQLQLRFSDQILANLCLLTPPCPHVIDLACHTNVIPPQKLTLIVTQIVTLIVTQTSIALFPLNAAHLQAPPQLFILPPRPLS